MKMMIRKSMQSDLREILEIYKQARSFMKEHNNCDQWTDGYPQKEIVEEDIKNQKSYVCVVNNKIGAVFYFAVETDETYHIIEKGNWINEDPYGVVHRLAVANFQKGVGRFCLDFAFEQWKNLRIDTHRDNLPMQKVLIKLGFKECGIIYIKNGDERLAFQKVERTMTFIS